MFVTKLFAGRNYGKKHFRTSVYIHFLLNFQRQDICGIYFRVFVNKSLNVVFDTYQFADNLLVIVRNENDLKNGAYG